VPVTAAALAEAITALRFAAMFAAVILMTFVVNAAALLALVAEAAATVAAVLANAALVAAAALAAVIVANNCSAEAGVTAGTVPLADLPVTVLD
jgi:hypothetical protein